MTHIIRGNLRIACHIALAFAGLTGFTGPSFGGEIRLAVPAFAKHDPFVEQLTSARATKPDIRIAITTYPSSSATLEAVLNGSVDLGLFTLDTLSQAKLEDPPQLPQLLTQPFQFETIQDLFYVQDTTFGQAVLNDINRTGLIPLAWWNEGLSQLIAKPTITKAEDFRGLRVGAPTLSFAPLLQKLGASLTLVRGAEIPEAMGKTVDASELAPHRATEDFLRRVGGRSLVAGVRPMVGTLAANGQFWSNLSESKKQSLQALARHVEKETRRSVLWEEDGARKAAEATHFKYVRFSKEHFEVLRSLSNDAYLEGRDREDAQRQLEVLHQAVASRQGSKKKTSIDEQPRGALPAIVSPVYFVTDREDEHWPDVTQRFGSKQSAVWSCGKVSFPTTQNRALGTAYTHAFRFEPDPLPAGTEQCLHFLQHEIIQSGATGVLVYIHGFWNRFDDAARRAIAMAHDLGFNGIVLIWSWPSLGSEYTYYTDEKIAAWSTPHIASFLTDLCISLPNTNFNLVAHSMGNRLLLGVMIKLAESRQSVRIRSVVYAAADESQRKFKAQIEAARAAANHEDSSQFATLYASEMDQAINLSEYLHRGLRAGSGGASNILVVDGIESIDARLNGHSYLFDHPIAINDLKKLLLRQMRAPQRGLRPVYRGLQNYWLLEN